MPTPADGQHLPYDAPGPYWSAEAWLTWAALDYEYLARVCIDREPIPAPEPQPGAEPPPTPSPSRTP